MTFSRKCVSTWKPKLSNPSKIIMRFCWRDETEDVPVLTNATYCMNTIAFIEKIVSFVSIQKKVVTCQRVLHKGTHSAISSSPCAFSNFLFQILAMLPQIVYTCLIISELTLLPLARLQRGETEDDRHKVPYSARRRRGQAKDMNMPDMMESRPMKNMPDMMESRPMKNMPDMMESRPMKTMAPPPPKNGDRCYSNSDCGGRRPVCANNPGCVNDYKCHECDSQDDCGRGEYCDCTSGNCKKTCIEHGDVCGGSLGYNCCQPNSYVCAPAGERYICQEKEHVDCYPSCDPCEDCRAGECVYRCGSCETCRNDFCVPIRCGPCEYCRNGRCVSSCDSCETCQGGRCVPITCGPSEYCRNGRCVSSCGSCETCQNGRCVSFCDSCETCQGGRCVPRTCGPCEYCRNGRCISTCGSDETCTNGECVPMLTPEPEPGTDVCDKCWIPDPETDVCLADLTCPCISCRPLFACVDGTCESRVPDCPPCPDDCEICDPFTGNCVPACPCYPCQSEEYCYDPTNVATMFRASLAECGYCLSRIPQPCATGCTNPWEVCDPRDGLCVPSCVIKSCEGDLVCHNELCIEPRTCPSDCEAVECQKCNPTVGICDYSQSCPDCHVCDSTESCGIDGYCHTDNVTAAQCPAFCGTCRECDERSLGTCDLCDNHGKICERSSGQCIPASDPFCDASNGSVIDAVVYFTTGAKAYIAQEICRKNGAGAEKYIKRYIAQRVKETNDALSQACVGAQIRVVHTTELPNTGFQAMSCAGLACKNETELPHERLSYLFSGKDDKLLGDSFGVTNDSTQNYGADIVVFVYHHSLDWKGGQSHHNYQSLLTSRIIIPLQMEVPCGFAGLFMTKEETEDWYEFPNQIGHFMVSNIMN